MAFVDVRVPCSLCGKFMSSLKGSTVSVSALCDRWKQSSTPHQDRKALVGEVKRQLDYVLLMLNFAF